MTTRHKKLLIVQTKAPYSSCAIQESLDLVLAAGTFDQDISLLLEGDACYQLLAGQTPELIQKKNTHKMLKALPIYGISTLLVNAHHAKLRGVHEQKNEQQTELNLKFLNHAEISELYDLADTVIRF